MKKINRKFNTNEEYMSLEEWIRISYPKIFKEWENRIKENYITE